MSAYVVHEVLEHAPESLSRLELLVLVAIADACDRRTRETSETGAATSVLAHKARTSPGSVRNAVSALVARGLVKPTGRAHRGKAQRYRVAELSDYHRTL